MVSLQRSDGTNTKHPLHTLSKGALQTVLQGTLSQRDFCCVQMTRQQHHLLKRGGCKHKTPKNAENGGYPSTQNGDIRSLTQLFRRKELQNETFLQSTELISFHLQSFKLFLVEVLYTCLINVLNRQYGSDEEAQWLVGVRGSTVVIGLAFVVYEQSASQGGQARQARHVTVLTL